MGQTFKLIIRLGNDAMCRPDDIARALHKLADQIAPKLESGASFDGPIMDDNGNKVGSWAID